MTLMSLLSRRARLVMSDDMRVALRQRAQASADALCEGSRQSVQSNMKRAQVDRGSYGVELVPGDLIPGYTEALIVVRAHHETHHEINTDRATFMLLRDRGVIILEGHGVMDQMARETWRPE